MVYLLLSICAAFAWDASDNPPTAAALIERFDREKSPVWADADKATFCYRGEADNVELIAGGVFKTLNRIGPSDVWTVSYNLPEIERAVISYHITATKTGTPPKLVRRLEGVWRGPKAPERAIEATALRGSLETVEIESQALEARRKLTVYCPPDSSSVKEKRVVYAADGQGIEGYARVIEPLIAARKLPPIVLIGVHNGGYLGGAADFNKYDTKKDFRAQEYFPEINPERFARHETFFCSEVSSWAERERHVSRDPKDRVLFGCSNGGRFVYEMALRHPDRFGSVLAFSIPGGGPIKLPDGYNTQMHFFLEAGTWEQQFQVYTSGLADALKQAGLAVEYRSRVGGHDEAIWREEFANGLLAFFGAR